MPSRELRPFTIRCQISVQRPHVMSRGFGAPTPADGRDCARALPAAGAMIDHPIFRHTAKGWSNWRARCTARMRVCTGWRLCASRPDRVLGVPRHRPAGRLTGGAQTVSTGGNTPPVANAGADQVVFEGVTVNLSGAANDADGDSLTFQWTQTGGPSVSISGATSRTAKFRRTGCRCRHATESHVRFRGQRRAGNQRELHHRHRRGKRTADRKRRAGPDRRFGGDRQLDGSGSSDPNLSGPLAYRWTQLGGSAVALSDTTAERPTFVAPVVTGAPITLEFALEVDDGPFADTDNVVVIVSGCGRHRHGIRAGELPVRTAQCELRRTEFCRHQYAADPARNRAIARSGDEHGAGNRHIERCGRVHVGGSGDEPRRPAARARRAEASRGAWLGP